MLPAIKHTKVSQEVNKAAGHGLMVGLVAWVVEALPIVKQPRTEQHRVSFADYGLCTNLHRDTDESKLSIWDSLVARRKTTESWLGRGGGGDAHLEDMKVRSS